MSMTDNPDIELQDMNREQTQNTGFQDQIAGFQDQIARIATICQEGANATEPITASPESRPRRFSTQTVCGRKVGFLSRELPLFGDT
jgi:hypothetical protein